LQSHYGISSVCRHKDFYVIILVLIDQSNRVVNSKIIGTKLRLILGVVVILVSKQEVQTAKLSVSVFCTVRVYCSSND
jgi:hypothetical protein